MLNSDMWLVTVCEVKYTESISSKCYVDSMH